MLVELVWNTTATEVYMYKLRMADRAAQETAWWVRLTSMGSPLLMTLVT